MSVAELSREKDLENRFSYAWNVYREIISLHRKQFLGWIAPLPLEFFNGKSFLDAGCGIGRNSRWPLEAGAASAYAFDCNEATVAVARQNLAPFPNCEVVLRSIYDLDGQKQYDVVFSIGVIHHLQRPRQAVENLVKAVKPGGTLLLWVYAREGNEAYLRWVDPIRRVLTSRMPPSLARILAKISTVLLKVYVRLPHRQEYLRLLRERSFRHVEAMVFDQLLPNISNYWTREEVLALIAGLPVRLVHLTHTHGMSWTLIAEKT
ncbi:MAG: class I SAM-dependent methyltransferase [Elusimicrobiota bacterium]